MSTAPATFDAALPKELEAAVEAEVERARTEDVAGRIWAKDPTLWGGGADTPELGNRLGWLTVAATLAGQVDDLEAFAHGLKEEGFTDAVVLGMGGSSLAPEVFARSFEATCLRLHVLDSTDADAIAAVEARIDPAKTVFVVSTKSGGTIETRSLADHFWAKQPEGANFVAVTDPGSSLEELATARGFRRTFLADPDIGGRYSALSPFGLVPAALMGAPLKALLDGAATAEETCREPDPAVNGALWLGAALGALSKAGRDKLTFVVSDPIASLGLWLEQLVAESTGKHGRGILPVADEPLGDAGDYGDDRVFAQLRVDGDQSIDALAEAGHPVFGLPVQGPEDLGRIFFVAEFVTAVAGWSLALNPFDQPNVQEAKDNTSKALEEGADEPFADTPAAALSELLDGAAPPDYVAIMAYAPVSGELDAAMSELRAAIRAKTKATTTFGYGPRFLHSTGQYHKGGAPTGRFLQLVRDAEADVEVPEKGFTFEQLKRAQAVGDVRTLKSHGLPTQRIRLGTDAAATVRELAREVR